MRVFGIGCPRTGTTTLGDCFQILGLNGTWFHGPLFRKVLVGEVNEALEYVAQFDAAQDLPWCLLYRELDEAFPGSKFILTIRRSSRVWLRSYRRHFAIEHDTLLTSDGSRAIYSTRHFPVWPAGIDGYREHNAAVRKYFRDRPHSLLTVCWERGDGWAELAEFLGLSLPDVAFPHSNASPAASATLKTGLLHLRRTLRIGQGPSSG